MMQCKFWFWTVAPLPVLGVVLALALGCQPGASPAPEKGGSGSAPPKASSSAPWFEDVTAASGVDFVHDPGASANCFMPECVGSGVALFDFDGDGLLDLYLVQNAGETSSASNRLYRQTGPLRFTDVSEGSGLDVRGRGMGLAIGDIDNDGRPDVFLGEYGRIRLFRNEGSGRFRDISSEAGIESSLWSTSSSFIDYDRDGWLDLLVVNYVNYDPSRWCGDSASRRDYCGPDAFPGVVTKLYRNSAPLPSGGRRFEERTVEAGISAAPGPGLGVVCLDFDGDTWQDFLVANDGKPNHLWINQRDGTFREEGVARGIAYNSMGDTEANMGIAVGDVDGDAVFDIFVTHLTEETPTLWKQPHRGVFEDATTQSKLHRPEWRGTGFGTVMGDFDNDGDLDIAAVNGRVKRPSHQQASDDKSRVAAGLAEYWRPYVERDQLFENDGDGRFRDVSSANVAFSGTASVSRGVAVGDLDNDGALDLVVTSIAGPARIFRNRLSGSGGAWLRVRAVDPATQRDAYGAEVVLHLGERKLWRWIQAGYSYLSSNDPRAHFGAGDAQTYERIEVLWPDGRRESFGGGELRREVRLEKGSGTPASPSK